MKIIMLVLAGVKVIADRFCAAGEEEGIEGWHAGGRVQISKAGNKLVLCFNVCVKPHVASGTATAIKARVWSKLERELAIPQRYLIKASWMALPLRRPAESEDPFAQPLAMLHRLN